MTDALRGKIYARVSMTGNAKKCWDDEVDPICTEEEFRKWRTDPCLKRDIEHAKHQFKTAQKAKFYRLTADRLENFLKNGVTRTQTIKRTIKSYSVNPITHETKLIGFSVIEGTTESHDPFPERLIYGLTKALEGNKMPVEDAIVTLAGEGVLGEEQLRSISTATKDYQQKLIGAIDGKVIGDRVNSRETITVDISDD
ncbi:hypothetical protein [Pseudanabaena sp. 'Roaring Creek']|uniref:hypothetical protein n=1 Tax=Pseudanabaena sp. 'Roaring Creek' TaxID=1681830 RepID=UPI0012E313B0|nr:hypothetical protein [Pseudanabaena sp. 'Roaring Creek']